MVLARFKARPLLTCIALVLCIAVASLLSNITTEAQLSGQAEAITYARKVVSKFLNSGTLWAALGFYAGWLWSGSRTRPAPLWGACDSRGGGVLRGPSRALRPGEPAWHHGSQHLD